MSRIKRLHYLSVKIIKFICIAVIVLLLSVVVLYLKKNFDKLYDIDDNIHLKFDSVSIIEDSSVVVENTNIIGESSSGVHYDIKSSKLNRTLSNLFKLENIFVDLQDTSSNKMLINADYGSFDQDKNIINVYQNIKIVFRDYTLYLNDAILDLNDKLSYSDSGIKIISDNANLRADKYKTSEDFNIIQFDGNVQSNIVIPHNSD